jgi:hypothetical protein
VSNSSLLGPRPIGNGPPRAIPRPLRAIRLRCVGCSETLADVRNCSCSFCALWPFRMGKRPRAQSDLPAPGCPTTSENRTAEAPGACSGPNSTRKTRSPLKAIRRYCLACADGNGKYVTWCPCDGLHSGGCPLWPYRLGIRPATACARFPALVVPSMMPTATVCLDDLPSGIAAAAGYLIERQQAGGGQ